jgi:hypothetical protein
MNMQSVACAVSVLILGCWMTGGQPAPGTNRPPSGPLTTTAAIQAMTQDEAKRQPAVTLRGVVTLSRDRSRMLFIEDSTGGIYCDVSVIGGLPSVGNRVEMGGLVLPGGFLPIFQIHTVKVLGADSMPTARPVTGDDIWAGKYDGDYVRMTGHVLSADFEMKPIPHWKVSVLSGGRQVTVDFMRDELAVNRVTNLIGAVISATGVNGPSVNERREIVSVGMSVAKADGFQVLMDSETVGRKLPLTTLSQLMAPSFFRERQLIRTRGTVSLVISNSFFIADGRNGLKVTAAENPGLSRGDVVEFFGFTASRGMNDGSTWRVCCPDQRARLRPPLRFRWTRCSTRSARGSSFPSPENSCIGFRGHPAT